mmetsp:Transcript_14995/g.27789  ORF Transcript_14995/g.27789 Transcript_14995/m.27789 type:complete len:671 (-) Transcript_14995:137-2149(-)
MPTYVPPHLRGSASKADQPSTRGSEASEQWQRVVPLTPRRGAGRVCCSTWSSSVQCSDRGDDHSASEHSERGAGGYPGSNRGSDRRDRDRDSRAFESDDRERNSAGGRFDSLKDEDSPQPSKGKGGGKGSRRDGDSDRRSGGRFAAAEEAGGDWRERRDGRRHEEDPTEFEIFGEVKVRSTDGIDFDKHDAIPVQITGNDVAGIVPIKRFSEAKLTDALFENLRRCGYERPTPVQKHSIPIVVSGRDLMACAQTGSGKTCGFMVPCLESLLRSGPPPAAGGARRPKPMPCALVLAPTRELAAQIYKETLKFAYATGIRSCIIYGGADMQQQRQELNRGCDVLIATPGRLTDMADRGSVSLELIQFFILDEADRMLDMGFEPQVRQIVEKLGMGKNSRFPRQSMMFSATFAKEVQLMAQDFLNDYVFITVGRVGSASEDVSQKVVFAQDVTQKVHQLEKAIKEYLPKDGLAVVFVETKKSADELEMKLYDSGVAVTAIHGDRSQDQREEALQAFKSGANPVLVATDVAARGLDIPNVSLVVNFDMPKQLDDYVHRIGRTGRAGRKGTAVALVNERCYYLSDLHHLLTEAKQDVPEWFGDLCNKSRSFGGKARGRGENRFGGQDLRLESGPRGLGDSQAKASVNAIPTPMRGSPGATRAPGSWGNTGAEDAW